MQVSREKKSNHSRSAAAKRAAALTQNDKPSPGMSKGDYEKRGKEGTERAGVGAARVPPVYSICVCGRFDETPLQLVGFDEFALIYWFY